MMPRRIRRPLAPPTCRAPIASRLRGLTLVLILAAAIVVLNGCGGGGDKSAPPPGNNAANDANDLAAAQRLYAGAPRTPSNFYSDAPPPGVSGVVATTHLKSVDLLGAAPGTVSFELCTENLGDAIAWSEDRAQFMNSYADLVDVVSQARYVELTRVPRADSSARLRHRVFRCTYLERQGTDLAADVGTAGVFNARPLDAAALAALSEYLWTYTRFNNADFIVTSSQPGTGNAQQLRHDIDMAQLLRASTLGDCDRVELLRWSHVVELASGALTRQLTPLRSFQVRRVNNLVELCRN
jgi:hypothetical protein